jgi:hypothetical protein
MRAAAASSVPERIAIRTLFLFITTSVDAYRITGRIGPRPADFLLVFPYPNSRADQHVQGVQKLERKNDIDHSKGEKMLCQSFRLIDFEEHLIVLGMNAHYEQTRPDSDGRMNHFPLGIPDLHARFHSPLNNGFIYI